MKRVLTALALGIGLQVGPVAAADIAPEGIIDSVFTWSAVPTSMPTAGGRETYIADTMLVVTAAAPGSVLDKLGARCLGMGQMDAASGFDTSSGSCTFADADGDQIFETWEETTPAAGVQAKGTGKILGGTGKFAGITGEYEYTSDFFASAKDGTFQGVGHKKGRYRIAKPS